MANENTYSDAADLRVAAILNQEVQRLVHDPTQLRQRLQFFSHPLSGSLGLKVGQIQPSYAMAAPGEDTAPSNTAVVDAAVTLTPAARALKFYVTDLNAITAPNGQVDPVGLARIVAENIERDYTDLICTAGATATTNVGGGGGVDATVDDLYDAIYQLRASNAQGPYTGVFAHNSFNELIGSLRGETGALQFQPATAELLAARGPGFQGSLLAVDLYSVDSVVEDTNVNQNFVFAAGGIGYTYAAVDRIAQFVDRRIVVQDAMSMVTMTFEHLKRALEIIGVHYPAVSVMQQAMLVGVTTDDA